MENIFKLHSDMTRQGPGDNESTKRALRALELPKGDIEVLDIGCGPGMQTVELAKNIEGTITALDFHKPYLDDLIRLAQREGVISKIRTLEGSMFELDSYFDKNSFDLIWSEGAIYIIGFEKGLQSVRSLLKDRGHLVVSEITWLTETPPEEVRDFWNEGYPQMGTLESNKEIAEKNGYEVVDTFTLPVSSWWDYYYNQLKDRCEKFKVEEPDNKELMEFIAGTEFEMELFRKYSSSYNYAFYILKKI